MLFRSVSIVIYFVCGHSGKRGPGQTQRSCFYVVNVSGELDELNHDLHPWQLAVGAAAISLLIS